MAACMHHCMYAYDTVSLPPLSKHMLICVAVGWTRSDDHWCFLDVASLPSSGHLLLLYCIAWLVMTIYTCTSTHMHICGWLDMTIYTCTSYAYTCMYDMGSHVWSMDSILDGHNPCCTSYTWWLLWDDADMSTYVVPVDAMLHGDGAAALPVLVYSLTLVPSCKYLLI